MAKESALSLFFLEDNKDKCLLWNLCQLTGKLLMRLQHCPITQQTLRYFKETSLFVARFASDLCDYLPPDSAQPMNLDNSPKVDF